MLRQKVLKTVMIACFTFPVAALANQMTTPAEPVPSQPAQPAPAHPQPAPPAGKAWYQCSAHNTEDDFWIHYGAPSDTECDAQASAVKVCEDFEKHECEVHDCRMFIH
jgi:hypothetical protein